MGKKYMCGLTGCSKLGFEILGFPGGTNESNPAMKILVLVFTYFKFGCTHDHLYLM
jgi:hypothetical protein